MDSYIKIFQTRGYPMKKSLPVLSANFYAKDIFRAADRGDIATLQLLIEKGANIQIKNIIVKLDQARS
jgi:hypothetical protein